jgi:hypothetical protein
MERGFCPVISRGNESERLGARMTVSTGGRREAHIRIRTHVPPFPAVGRDKSGPYGSYAFFSEPRMVLMVVPQTAH